MRKLRRVLVAIRDVDRVPRSQLQKAATIARAAGARVELFHANGEPLIPESLRSSQRLRGIGVSIDQVEKKSRQRLERLRKSRVFSGLKVEACVVRDYPPHEAVVRRVQATRADLVVAASVTHHLASRWFLFNTDWELIRACPCPILFVKSRGDYRKPTLLAAVDPFHENAKPANLEGRLLKTAKSLASLLRGRLHVVHAYLPLAIRTLVPMEQAPVWIPPGAEEANTRTVTRAFDRLARRAAIAPRRRHLVTGDVPGGLLATGRKIGAGIVVMGAVSRSGLKRLFIGSTAERVLDELRCDALIVKPPGFKVARSKMRPPSPATGFYY
jgi:universal stress protein E